MLQKSEEFMQNFLNFFVYVIKLPITTKIYLIIIII